MIYKICPAPEWAQAQQQRMLTGSALDRKDGFLHFSTRAQLPATLARHFADADAVVLLAVDESGLGEALRFEPSRDGALFPHLYGPLPRTAVVWAKPLTRGSDGVFTLPLECE